VAPALLEKSADCAGSGQLVVADQLHGSRRGTKQLTALRAQSERLYAAA